MRDAPIPCRVVPSVAPDERTPRQVDREFKRALARGARIRPAGEARDDPARLFEGNVELVVGACNAHLPPEAFSNLGDLPQGTGESLFVASHPTVFPHDLPELLVERIHRAASIDVEDLLNSLSKRLLVHH